MTLLEEVVTQTRESLAEKDMVFNAEFEASRVSATDKIFEAAKKGETMVVLIPTTMPSYGFDLNRLWNRLSRWLIDAGFTVDQNESIMRQEDKMSGKGTVIRSLTVSWEKQMNTVAITPDAYQLPECVIRDMDKVVREDR